MPRPPRCRFIDSYPEYWRFSPVHSDRTDVLVMTLDEFETIRLIDKCGLTQEQCAVRMGVARTTVTAIYDSARKKLADSLVDGTILQIGGGHYRLNKQGADHVKPKGEKTMRIAVTYDNGEVFQHFGHTEFFKFYDVREGRITEEQVVDTNGSGHGALAGFLKEAGTDALICGGIGPRTRRPRLWSRAAFSTTPTPPVNTMAMATARGIPATKADRIAISKKGGQRNDLPCPRNT